MITPAKRKHTRDTLSTRLRKGQVTLSTTGGEQPNLSTPKVTPTTKVAGTRKRRRRVNTKPFKQIKITQTFKRPQHTAQPVKRKREIMNTRKHSATDSDSHSDT